MRLLDSDLLPTQSLLLLDLPADAPVRTDDADGADESITPPFFTVTGTTSFDVPLQMSGEDYDGDFDFDLDLEDDDEAEDDEEVEDDDDDEEDDDDDDDDEFPSEDEDDD